MKRRKKQKMIKKTKKKRKEKGVSIVFPHQETKQNKTKQKSDKK